MTRERVQKTLARAGIASRRAAEQLIEEGRVTINGRVAELGATVDPAADSIKVDGRRVPSGALRGCYYLMNKPRAVVTTMNDPQGRPTVGQILERAGLRAGVFPVGRLDYDAEGLLLVTNDGELAHAALHPSRGLPKVYRVKVRGTPDPASLGRLRRGLDIGDGEPTRPARVAIARPGENPWLEITLKEGRPNQIKRMLMRTGHRVLRLRRVAVGPLRLTGVRPGEVRPLSPEELRKLRAAAGLRQSAPKRSS